MEEIEVSGSERGVPAAEETRTGPTFSPAVDIFETEQALVLVADMPGVAKEAVSVDLEEDRLTITGETGPAVPESETLVSGEYVGGRYVRRFALSNVIDQSAITATNLGDGVLRVTLPKVKQVQPRKIAIETT